MAYLEEMIRKLDTDRVREQLRYLYGTDETMLERPRERYAALLRRHAALYGEGTAPTIRIITMVLSWRRRSIWTRCVR